MADTWTMVAGIAALVLFVTVPLYMTDGAWSFLTSLYRKGRLRLAPTEATCERLLWSDLLEGELHQCTHSWASHCHGHPHRPGNACWRRSISVVLNRSRRATVVKPECLPLQKDFLCVDWNTVYAFILMSIDAKYDVKALKTGKNIDKGNVKLKFQLMKRRGEDPLLLLHLNGSFRRKITKEHMLHLLQGEPPLLRDPRTYSISTDADLKRGGWVVALGFDRHVSIEEEFLPVYLDTIEYKNKRGGVFWRSIDRVSEIIEAQFLPSFPECQDAIESAIQALNYMKTHETESGVSRIFALSSLHAALSARERRDVIDLFNGPPIISDRERPAFQRKYERMVDGVLIAAVRGVEFCVGYCKNPGRELDRMISKDYQEFSEIYVCGC